jgi:hypothetical protein
MIRQVKIAKDTAVKARSQAIITLKTIIVTAPAELREQLQPLNDRELIAACRALRYETMSGPPTRRATRCGRWPSATTSSTPKLVCTTACSPP